jgi:hypothetical protein
MEQGQLSWVANFIWGIPDDVLRDLYVRGKYRDVVLPIPSTFPPGSARVSLASSVWFRD